MPHWREKKAINKKQAVNFLNNYEWSSYHDHTGGNNFDIVLNKDAMSEYFPEESYKKDFEDFLNDLNFEDLSGVTLD